MKMLVTWLLMFLMAILGIAQSQEESFDPPGGPGRFGGPPGGPEGFGGPPGRPRPFGGPLRGPDGPGGSKHGPSVLELFPACKPMADAMREKHRELMQDGKIGPRNCQQQDRKACMQNDMKIVRCAITETPSAECMDQLNTFLKGDTCSGSKDDSTTENGVNST